MGAFRASGFKTMRAGTIRRIVRDRRHKAVLAGSASAGLSKIVAFMALIVGIGYCGRD
jgi:hypothetical protein